jgi:hypothetical protein
MKKTGNLVVLIALCVVITINSQAQGRGNGRGHGNNKNHHGNGQHDRNRGHDDHWQNYHNSPQSSWQQRNRQYDHSSWRPSHGHRAQTRYIYYRDYNVYYDCHRRMFLSLSGRNWVMSEYMPYCMRSCDFQRVTYMDVDYYDDDLPRYMERNRPRVFVSVSATF